MGTRLIEQSFSCPICKSGWRSQSVDTVSHQGQDSDFCPHYAGQNPLPYFLIQCPSCQFCAYPDDYSQENQARHKGVSQKKIRTILDQPLAKKLQRDPGRYYLAGKICEQEKRNPYHIGNIYLRGSWCCRNLEDRHSEIELQQLAVKFFRNSVEKSTLTSLDNIPVVTYLVGELYRRLEARSLAREWFGSVEEVIYDSDQQWIVELAKKQAELNEYLLN